MTPGRRRRCWGCRWRRRRKRCSGPSGRCKKNWKRRRRRYDVGMDGGDAVPGGTADDPGTGGGAAGGGRSLPCPGGTATAGDAAGAVAAAGTAGGYDRADGGAGASARCWRSVLRHGPPWGGGCFADGKPGAVSVPCGGGRFAGTAGAAAPVAARGGTRWPAAWSERTARGRCGIRHGGATCCSSAIRCPGEPDAGDTCQRRDGSDGSAGGRAAGGTVAGENRHTRHDRPLLPFPGKHGASTDRRGICWRFTRVEHLYTAWCCRSFPRRWCGSTRTPGRCSCSPAGWREDILVRIAESMYETGGETA